MKKDTKNVPVRTLNMEEKKKFEKIIHQDIERAKLELRNKHNEQSKVVEEKLVKDSKAQKLLSDYKETAKRLKAIEKEAEALGYRVNTWNEPSISVTSNHKELAGTYKEQRVTEEKLETMKRTYTLKLFAGGEEAQELFESLAKELANLTK